MAEPWGMVLVGQNLMLHQNAGFTIIIDNIFKADETEILKADLFHWAIQPKNKNKFGLFQYLVLYFHFTAATYWLSQSWYFVVVGKAGSAGPSGVELEEWPHHWKCADMNL